ncbi:uncharacterized protein LOC129924619 [Biomphalaria glabrata]|uniref:Uncharacterized protein LOC129924619 n=1 Tax=Biomphalaria glabrata TaxID=6526 RepID=A0A9W2ZP38_BIOGL|nr:uncharacterized protein LOC129924619 [Biomphalaria glabrata]
MNLGSQDKHLQKDSTIAVSNALDQIRNCSSYHFDKAIEQPKPQITKLLAEIETILSREQYAKAEQLIREFADIFASDEADCGRTNMVQHRIDTGNTRPIRQPPRRLPLAKQEAIDLKERIRQQGVIEPSNSPWCSPVVLVKKKDDFV